MERSPAPLVGRELSLGVLQSAVRRTSEGQPCLLLLSGETGVGKTRLVKELVATESVTLLYGTCLPMAGDPLPFAPLIQALHRLSRSGTWNLQLERSPHLARLVPGIEPTRPMSAGELGASSPFGLFQAVMGLLERLGAAAPAALVVEDVQWADRSTLDLVRFLATNLTTERVAVVVTYRDDSVVAGTPLASWLAELARLEITQRVPLERLGPDDTARLVTSLVGSDPDLALVQSTITRSAGNPLFAEHLVLQGDGGRGSLPATLSELLTQRVATLPDGTRRLLRAAAVVGRASEVDLVARTLGWTVEELEEQLRPAIDQHILEIRRDDTMGFRHPAFEEVVYAELLPGERSSLHRAAAQALEATVRNGSGPHQAEGEYTVAGELARHWAAAGDNPRALDAAVTAGTAAERMFAFADAHTSFARAADLLPLVPDSAHAPVRLLKHAAQAASLMGDGDEAVRLVERALSLTSDPTVRASLCTRLGSIHYLAGRGHEAQLRFREALALVPEEEESVLVARIHAGLGLLGAAWSQYAEADESCERGLAVARAVGARREEGQVLSAMGVVAAARGDVDAGVDHLRESLAIAREVGNPNDLGTAYINLSHVLGLAGRHDEVAALGREGITVLEKVGLARQSGSFLRANTSHALIDAGRLSEATAVIDEALAYHPRGIRAAPVLIQAGRVDLVQGNLDRARKRLAQAREIIESETAPDAYLRELIEVAADIELWAGRPDAAYDLVVEGLALIAGTDEERTGALLVALGLRALADQSETRRDPASRARLDYLRRPLEDAMATMATIGTTLPDDTATAAWQHAEAERLNRRSDPVAWAEVADRWHELGRPIPAAYARWREAEARLDRGADVHATAAVRAAHDAAVELGATQLAAEVRRLAGWHRVDLVDPVAQPDPDALQAYRLTPREVEVLTGLAAGRTNQEIADHLFISVKTASVHVSNILRKLDVSGRQEAGRVAHRLGVSG